MNSSATSMNINRLSRIPFHLLGWAVFILFPFFLGVPFREEILYKFTLNSFFLAIFFYSNSEWLVPEFLIKRRFVTYLLLVILFMVVLGSVNYLFHHLLELDTRHFPHPNRRPHGHHTFRAISRTVFSSLFILAVSTSYTLFREWFKSEKKKQELENRNLTSELSFLKSQVSPHFLFNTLNNIYSLSLTHSERTSESILKLSQLLRYMLYESEARKVPLEREIEYLHNYIELQKMRIRDDVLISFKHTGDFNSLQIEPMLLIPFVENAFKHGINYSKPSWIKINLHVSSELLEFFVSNSIVEDSVNEESSGIGLGNVKRRLELLYPDAHVLIIRKTEKEFMIHLKINLKHELPDR